MLVFQSLLKAAAVWLAADRPVNGAPALKSDNAVSQVDLGYAVYQGVENSTTGLTIWKGIPYAAPPVGKLRWQAPRLPERNRTGVVLANTFGPQCAQQSAFFGVEQPYQPGDEDCLYLNVYAPSNTSDLRTAAGTDGAGSTAGGLPVLVYIHGGGYGAGNGALDMSGFITSNDKRLIVVSIQYRLGAFGFLASPELKARGVLNAGLLDQEFALQWTQQHISKFGGDPKRITIYGESAGGGSAIAASPYSPTQPYYNDSIPQDRYSAFAAAAGCAGPGPVFDCLVAAKSSPLLYANSNITGPGSNVPYGNWAFIPVTDGEYLTEPASVRLAKTAVNGKRILAAGNANEGNLFVPPGAILTEASLKAWIKGNFVNLSEQNVTAVLAAYPSVPGPDGPSSPRFETSGLGPATAINVSQIAAGHQQRAYNIYAEATFVCPAYWLADAFSTYQGRESFFYQYSIPFAAHGLDNDAAFGTPKPMHGPEFVKAFRRMYGNFIVGDNPSISDALANGPSAADPTKPNPASRWPRWTASNRAFLNLNETGGIPYKSTLNTGDEVTQFSQPGLRNAISLADAYTWEGGRGRRCDFWKTINSFIPH